MTPHLTITNEQMNSLPLLLGIMEDMGIRTLLDTHQLVASFAIAPNLL